MRNIKSEKGELLLEDTQVKERWGQYFSKLLNDGEGEAAVEKEVLEEMRVDELEESDV